MTPSLEFCHVWKGYGPGLSVLCGVTFTLFSGEIALLIGENGAGKTTTFDIACGNQRADHGTIYVHGVPIDGRSPESLTRLGLRRMYQFPTVFRTLSVRDNVLLAVQPSLYARFCPWPFHKRRNRLWQEVRDSVALLFKACPFLHNGQTTTDRLSFGQQRIVDFLRVLAAADKTTVLLLDEPFAGIHVDVAEIMWQMIRHMATVGAAVLVIAHENEANRFKGLRRLQLVDGRIQCSP